MSQETIQKVGFGTINDQDDSLKGKDGVLVALGLNEGFITKFEYNPTAGKDGAAGDAIDITFMVGEREFRRRLYDVTRVYDGNGNQITDETDPQFIEKFNENMNQVKAVVTHVVKSLGVTQQQIDNALATPPANFADWAKIMTSLAPQGFENKPVDGFLEYQWNISEGQDRTYLELPKNMRGGRFLESHIVPVGSWKEEYKWVQKDDAGVEKEVEGLRYVDDAGNVHPFIRSKNFMTSNKAIQQIDGQEPAAGAAASGANATTAKKSTW